MRISDWSSDVCSSDLKTPWLAEAQRLANDYLDLLGSRDYSQLMSRMKLKEDELRQDIELIQSHNPRHGSSAELRVGKECVSTCRSRGSPCHEKQNNT